MFLSAVAGNYASYVSYRRTHAHLPIGSDIPAWYYDIDKARPVWWLRACIAVSPDPPNPHSQ